MTATTCTRVFAGGRVEARAHSAPGAHRLAEAAARLGARASCSDAPPRRIRVWPASEALPYLTIDVRIDDVATTHRLLAALQRRAGTRLRASVTGVDGTAPGTWDGAQEVRVRTSA